MANTAIFFDMDGTIADLYGVDNWLTKLRAYDATPYTDAKPLVNLSLLARLLNQLQRAGYTLGVISWTAKDSTAEYHKAVEQAKRDWLAKHLPSVNFDEIFIVEYGFPKESCANGHAILFDDNEEVRAGWSSENRTAFDVDNIIEILKSLR